MTAPLDLSALVTCHTLYILFTSLQSAVFLLNSRLGPYTATSGRSHREGDHGWRHPFFRSYGASLPSSLTWLLSRTLGFSPHPPVSVCGTDSLSSTHRRFSWQCGIGRFALSKGRRVLTRLGFNGRRIYLSDHPTRFDCHDQSTADLASCVSP